jgi:predicted amidohydrolase
VVAAAQVGQHNEKRASYGHSMVVGPWGDVLAELGEEWTGEPELAIVDIKQEDIDRIRREVPLQRNWDVYGRV